MLIDETMAQIEREIPELAHRVDGAAALSALVQAGTLPQSTPFAYVLPLGFRGGQPDAATGLYRQNYDETIGVVIVDRAAGDATGASLMVPIHALRDRIVLALAGWEPEDAFGVFVATRGDLLSLVAGTVIYQVTFTIQNQLRIAR